MQRMHVKESGLAAAIAAAGNVVLAGNDAVAALVDAWREGWRRRLEWCPQELSFLASPQLRAYQERISYYAHQVQSLTSASQSA